MAILSLCLQKRESLIVCKGDDVSSYIKISVQGDGSWDVDLSYTPCAKEIVSYARISVQGAALVIEQRGTEERKELLAPRKKRWLRG